MSKSIFSLLLFSFLINTADAQIQKADLIEGGQLILEVIKLLKPENKQNARKCLRSICFENLTEGKIRVILKKIEEKKEKAAIEIVSLKGGNDCSYSIKSGIYSYEIQSETGEILKKAELNFIECSSLLIKVSN